jgi:hypothetical protein
MPINIENLSTEVIPEPESSGHRTSPSASRWEEAEKIRENFFRWKRNRSRTAAEGFDD